MRVSEGGWELDEGGWKVRAGRMGDDMDMGG